LEIVEHVDKQRAIIDGAEKILENWEVNFNLPSSDKTVKLGDKTYFEILGGGTPSKDKSEYWNGDIPWISPKDMKSFIIDDSMDHISRKVIEESSTNLVPSKAILIVVRSGILKHSLPISISAKEVAINQDIKALVIKKYFLPEFIAFYLIKNRHGILRRVRSGPTVEGISLEILNDISIPKISSEDQEVLVSKVMNEMKSISSVKEIHMIAESDINNIISAVWES
jgi:type I restriction enzyme S subunit